MLRFTTRRALTALSLLVLAAGTPGLAQNAGQVQIAGTAAMKYSDRHPVNVGDVEGHVLAVTQSKGSNRNTGQVEYMNDAKVTNSELADITQGNGPHQGYIVFAKDSDVTVSRWNGTVKTVLSQDKKPITTFEGTWTLVRGAGHYAGARGSGRYRGQVTTPEKEYTLEWEGNLVTEATAGR